MSPSEIVIFLFCFPLNPRHGYGKHPQKWVGQPSWEPLNQITERHTEHIQEKDMTLFDLLKSALRSQLRPPSRLLCRDELGFAVHLLHHC